MIEPMQARPLVISCLLLHHLAACQDDVVITADDIGTQDTETITETITETTSTTDTTTTDTDTGQPLPTCGDGILDPDEECDDGNLVDGDGCSSRCESACAVGFWIGLTVDAGWFDVQAMQPHPADGIELAGDVSGAGFVSYLRYLRVLGTSTDLALDSPPLGPAGTVDLPQSHQVTAVAVAAQGDLLALGISTEVLVMGEAPVSRYWLARFAGADLSEQWRVEVPTATPAERPLDLALLAAGDALITSTVRIADNDDDVLAARRSFADGSEQWSATYSGKFDGGWSLDHAGRVAVGAGDLAWLAGILRVDWQTNETTIFELDPDDGTVLTTAVPLADPGNQHEQQIWDFAAGGDGRVAVAIAVDGPASVYDTFAVFMLEAGEVVWVLDGGDMPWDDGEPYIHPRVAFDAAGNVLVTGTYTHEFNFATAPRAFVIAVAPDGTQLCSARVGEGQEAAVVPKNGFFADGRGAINLDTYGMGGMGPMSGNNWLAGLRGGW